MDWGGIVRAVLFAIFAVMTGIVMTVIEPTYDNLFIPEMAPSSIYAPFLGSGHTSNLFSEGAAFSNYLLLNVVDPLAVLVIIVVGLLYLLRATLPTALSTKTSLAPRLVLGILLANMVLPLAWLLWSIAAAIYPIFYGYGGGAWRTYSNIVGPGAISFSWDNGVLAFVAALALLSLVLVLSFLVAFRDAIVAVLLALLPPLTLLWPIPTLSGLAGRAWRLFAEMTFLPSLLVVPLALAVGAPGVLIVIALFTVAVGMPMLLSQVGGSLSSVGFPHSGSILSGGFLGGTRGTGRATIRGLQRGGLGFQSGFRGPRGSNIRESPLSATDMGPSHHTASASPSISKGVLWGVGEGLGRIGRHLSPRAITVQPERRRPPPALEKSRRI